MRLYSYRHCPIWILKDGTVVIADTRKGKSFCRWYTKVYHKNSCNPLKDVVWLLEYKDSNGQTVDTLMPALMNRIKLARWKKLYYRFIADEGLE